jgi:hypothetical protein
MFGHERLIILFFVCEVFEINLFLLRKGEMILDRRIDGPFSEEGLVEISRVLRSLRGRLEGRLCPLFSQNGRPVHSCKEWMLFDLLRI